MKPTTNNTSYHTFYLSDRHGVNLSCHLKCHVYTVCWQCCNHIMNHCSCLQVCMCECYIMRSKSLVNCACAPSFIHSVLPPINHHIRLQVVIIYVYHTKHLLLIRISYVSNLMTQIRCIFSVLKEAVKWICHIKCYWTVK